MSDELHTHKIIVDFAKGTNERIPLTAEEIAAFKKEMKNGKQKNLKDNLHKLES